MQYSLFVWKLFSSEFWKYRSFASKVDAEKGTTRTWAVPRLLQEAAEGSGDLVWNPRRAIAA